MGNQSTSILILALVIVLALQIDAAPHGSENLDAGPHGTENLAIATNVSDHSMGHATDGPLTIDHGSMKPFFNTDSTVFLLFPQLQPKNAGQYIAALLATFILSFVNSTSENIRVLIFRRGVDDNIKSERPPISWIRRASFTIFKGIAAFISYTVMLLAMSFNVGLLMAIIAGVMVPTFLFNYDGAVVPKSG